ncbi:MarR family winged helix-turn-helix transcriptional regulator [Nocardiopsis sp. LOL_012]|uniref:MarR family winged helix-turn-helix transcriptional regulator n=1 Tax=Nocardiopsis sp. LOL_012 TaxID=3345409 RepID=UPI003A837497
MNDVVDLLLSQWERQRPDLDVSSMGVVGRLSRASRVVGRAVEGGLAEEGLEAWEFDVLATLRRSGEPYSLTPKELVGMMMVGSAAMTHRVDRLVSRGLVTRETDPANRRRTLVTLAPEGLELIDRAVVHHVANQRGLLAGLDEKEREQLADLLRKLLLSLGDTV